MTVPTRKTPYNFFFGENGNVVTREPAFKSKPRFEILLNLLVLASKMKEWPFSPFITRLFPYSAPFIYSPVGG